MMEPVVFTDTIIPFNKKRLVLLTAVSVVLSIAIILYFLYGIPIGDRVYYSIQLYVVGVGGIIAFPIACVFLTKRLIDKKPALIISKEGLTNNTQSLYEHEIPWEDIQGFSTVTIYRHRLIMVHVKQPELYIERQQNFVKRKMMTANYGTYGTPISIATSALSMPVDDVLRLLQEQVSIH